MRYSFSSKNFLEISNWPNLVTVTAINSLENMVARVGDIYSLPAVAMELVELLEEPAYGSPYERPQLDASQITRCVERDPAIAAKLLRVVNSSVIGLSGRVGNLTQAVAMLGTRPLKLLVLGFSLPKQLERSLTRESLSAHWRASITRAVAARRIAKQHLETSGDDAFVAALLADLGKLVMLGELGDSYARLIVRSRDMQLDLGEQSRLALGFDHFQLTAALLDHWNLPRSMSQTVAALADRYEHRRHDLARQPLARAVVLADLIVEVVEGHSLSAMPRLCELSAAWAGHDVRQLKRLVAEIDRERRELASVFDVALPDDDEMTRLVADAYERLSQSAEEAQSMWPIGAEPQSIGQTNAVRMAVGAAIAQPFSTFREQSKDNKVRIACTKENATQRLLRSVTTAILSCRGNRTPLSLLLVEGQSPLAFDTVAEVSALLAASVAQLWGDASVLSIDPATIAVIVPGYDRHEAKRLADRILAKQLAGDYAKGQIEKLNIGVAGVEVISRGFDPNRLVQGAARCLVASRHSEGHAVKSIEVY